MSGDEDAMLVALVDGRPQHEVAKVAKMSVSTVQRRRRDPEIRRQVAELRGQRREEALGQLAEMRSVALARLRALVDEPDPTVALRAVREVLNGSARFETLHDIDVRLAALEEATAQATGTGAACLEQVGDADAGGASSVPPPAEA